MTASNDSTAVREGEELDSASLEAYLRNTLSLDSGTSNHSLEIQQFPGGHSNLTYLIRYNDSEYVLRRPPVGPVAPTAHDMPREYRLLSVINPRFPLAPKPILLCEDSAVIGVPFYLMEHRRGLIVRSKLPDQLQDDPALRRRLSESVIDTLVGLHAVDIHSSGIISMGKPEGFVNRQVRGWADRWQRSKTAELAEMDQVIDWLMTRIPAETLLDATVVHNDFKLDNLMLDVDDPARVVAVLDWEMCAMGDPLIDVGLLLSYWTMSGGGEENSSLRAITHGPGWFTREEIIERYEKATGRNLGQIAFYETFARFKVAVVIQQIYFRFVKGQTKDQRFQHFDLLVNELTRDALQLARSSGI
ncbi:MAG TPA: phosphotransferase family protein [Pyrinomonadaceae bacterium]|nr:phosphotransferase family protein [Pyrinomonadaceae bacterium]